MILIKGMLFFPTALLALQFAQNPAMTSAGGGQWQATFAVSETTDVEISIVNTADSTVVRHLAAGMLGGKAPAPLQAGSLSQTLTWDGKDDFGRTAANPEALSLRVRAGLSPVLTGFAGENLYDQSGTTYSVPDADGNVYVMSKACGLFTFVRKYDASGNYIKTIFPPRADLPSDSVKGYRVNVLPDGRWVPKTYPTLGFRILFSLLIMSRINVITADGKIAGNCVQCASGTFAMDTNGAFTDTTPTPLGKVAAAAGTAALNPAAGFNDGPYVFERLCVDRRNESVYWNGNNEISDWNNPVARQTGANLDNMFVAPNGFLYGWDNVHWSAHVGRYSSQGSHPPVPYAGTGSNLLTGGIGWQGGAAGTPGNHRGLAVGWQGQAAVFTEADYLFQVPDTVGHVSAGNWDGVPVGDCRLLVTTDPAADKNFTREGMGCVRYDPAGNYYVGMRKRATKPILPAPAFATDRAFLNSGAVVKFHRDSNAIFSPVTGALSGHERVYPQPFGPFTKPANGQDPLGLGDAACNCRNSYFDVDPYGRLYIPNGVACKVYIADNAGNTIAAMGDYGNPDSRGGLPGPAGGVTYAEPAIPLAWPTSVGASEDFVYIADAVNARLVRVQMVYALDNIPDLTRHGQGVAADKVGAPLVGAPTLAAEPNPFNPESRIRVTLPAAAHVSLGVYDMNGRLVRTLASGKFGKGIHQFTWNAMDAAGSTVSAGVYLYRLTAGKQVRILKAVLVR